MITVVKVVQDNVSGDRGTSFSEDIAVNRDSEQVQMMAHSSMLFPVCGLDVLYVMFMFVLCLCLCYVCRYVMFIYVNVVCYFYVLRLGPGSRDPGSQHRTACVRIMCNVLMFA